MTKTVLMPHVDEDGFVEARPNPYTAQDVVLYDADGSGFDRKDGRWVVYCAEHGEIAQETNRRRAQKLMREPEQWCSKCGRVEKDDEADGLAVKPVPFAMKSPADQAREIRYAAMLVEASPEKVALFERIYGVALADAFETMDGASSRTR